VPGKISGGVAHQEAPVPVRKRRSSGAVTFLPATVLWSMLGSLQHQDDEGEVRGGSIEGEERRKRRLPEEWTRGGGGFENGGAGDSSVGEGVDECRRAS
jgi:hypothetical protein